MSELTEIKGMTEIETMNADIGRLRETIEHIFHRILAEKKGTNLFDTGSYYTIIDHLHFVKYGVAREYRHPFEFRNTEKEETEISLEMAYMSGDIWRLREVVYQLLLEAFYNEKEIFNENYNWLYFGGMINDDHDDYRIFENEPEPEIERMKEDINRMQEVAYQLLGGVFCQEIESESIYGHYNWMKYGKRYNKYWLNKNGEPYSEDEEDQEEVQKEEGQEEEEEDDDDEECEQTHYFEYQYKYRRDNLPLSLKCI